MRVAGCFLRYNDEFVLVHRLPHKPDGDTWGLPGGKVEKDESDLEAIIRELGEETGYDGDPSEFKLLGAYDFTSPVGVDFVYVTYELTLTDPHEVVIEESAHSEFIWVNVREADKRDDLIYGLKDLFRKVSYL